MIPTPEPASSAPSVVTIRVLLFSVLRERIGQAALDLKLEPGSNTDDLLRHLVAAHPAIASYASVARLAVNEEYVDDLVELTDGDEVALITPVSGG